MASDDILHRENNLHYFNLTPILKAYKGSNLSPSPDMPMEDI